MLEHDSLYIILKTIAHQIGIDKQEFDSKFDIAKSIYNKFSDGKPDYPEDSTYGITANIIQLVNKGLITPTVKSNKLTYNGSNWIFERIPDIGEYVIGDLYVNANKVGSYQGFTCENTLSNWEEASIAITSASFGNQAVSLIKEIDGEWKLK